MTTTETHDAFGLPLVPLSENPLFQDPTPDEIAAEPEVPIEVAEEVPAEVIETPADTEPTEEAVPEVGTETPETASESVVEEPATVEELIFGKYKDLEAAQKGYDNLRDLQRRTAERARAYEQENATVLTHARELEATLQQAIPYIKSLQQARQEADELGYPAQVAPVTPEMVDLMVRTRTEEARAQFNAERQAADEAATRESAVLGFYEKHAIVQEDEVDQAMFEAVRALNDSWDKADTEVNVGDPDTLEIVFETIKNPELLKVLQLNPALIDNDEGMTLARFQAALLRGESPITQGTRTVPASEVGQRKLPVTESASTGGTSPQSAPTNEWTEAKRAVAESRGKTTGSPFFE